MADSVFIKLTRVIVALSLLTDPLWAQNFDSSGEISKTISANSILQSEALSLSPLVGNQKIAEPSLRHLAADLDRRLDTLEIAYPNLDAIKESRDNNPSWPALAESGISQSRIPMDPKLLSILGIQVMDNIFVFAGFVGDWANALGAAAARVVYTDLDVRVVAAIQRQGKLHPGMPAYAADPLKEPASDSYDWSFSYEPFPLIPNEMIWILLRSLRNRRGSIVISCKAFEENFLRQLEIFSRVYTLDGQKVLSVASRTLLAIKPRFADLRELPSGAKKTHEPSAMTFEVLTVATHPRLRTFAELDWDVILALQRFKGNKVRAFKDFLMESGISADIQNIMSSLQRVSALSAAIPKYLCERLILLHESSPASRTKASTGSIRLIVMSNNEK